MKYERRRPLTANVIRGLRTIAGSVEAGSLVGDLLGLPEGMVDPESEVYDPDTVKQVEDASAALAWIWSLHTSGTMKLTEAEAYRRFPASKEESTNE